MEKIDFITAIETPGGNRILIKKLIASVLKDVSKLTRVTLT
jgi:hypothetical protein